MKKIELSTESTNCTLLSGTQSRANEHFTMNIRETRSLRLFWLQEGFSVGALHFATKIEPCYAGDRREQLLCVHAAWRTCHLPSK